MIFPLSSRSRWASWVAVIQPAGLMTSTVSSSRPASDQAGPPAISGPLTPTD